MLVPLGELLPKRVLKLKLTILPKWKNIRNCGLIDSNFCLTKMDLYRSLIKDSC